MQLIQNYGLFWRRALIPEQSGKQDKASLTEEWPRSGKLLGVGVRKKRQGVVDFSNQRGIYALYDDQFRLTYVGQAGGTEGRLYKRLRRHTTSILAERWSRFSWFGITPLGEEMDAEGNPMLSEALLEDDVVAKKNVVLDHIEAVLIAAAEPLRNKQGGRFGKDVTHYRQYKGEFDENEPFEPGDLEKD